MARAVALAAAGMQVPALACAVPIAGGVVVLIAGGLYCCCCGSLMLILPVVGVMDLSVMAAVTAAITIERLAPAGDRVARTIGAAAVGTAPLLIARHSDNPSGPPDNSIGRPSPSRSRSSARPSPRCLPGRAAHSWTNPRIDRARLRRRASDLSRN